MFSELARILILRLMFKNVHFVSWNVLSFSRYYVGSSPIIETYR